LYKQEQCSLFVAEKLKMQIQKEDIRRIILKIAREEFIEKGFKDTSMRTIAQKTGVGLSNIYNYFRNKDEIFREVLAPVLAVLKEITDSHNTEKNLTIDVFYSQEYLKRNIEMFVDIILKYRDELRILFFKSYGSALEDFTEEYIDENTRIGLEYLRLMKDRYPELNINISDFFIHAMTSWWLNTIGELIMHDLSRNELERFLTDYMEYSTGGWRSIMKVKKPSDSS